MGAFDFCKSCDMELLRLVDLNETLYFLDLCQKNLAKFTPEPGAYIGGIAPEKSSKTAVYTWFETEEKISFNIPWVSGEPNNLNTIENCLGVVSLNGGKFGFADVSCVQAFKQFICQDVRAVSKGMNPNATMPKVGR